jgi:predicted enzyme related to lactoylglutathione lyase
MNANDYRGRFVWYELMTTDTKGAQAFYPKVTGWRVVSTPMPGMQYDMWYAGEAGVGGMMTLPEEARKMGAPSHWIGYVAVDDVDAGTAKVQELGGRVYMGPMDIPNVGRFSVVADPQGATIALFKGQGEAPPESAEKFGKISWHELHTTDPAAAWSFYSAVFGWEKKEAMEMGEHGVYQMYGTKDQTIGGMMKKMPGQPGPAAWLYYTHIPNLDEGIAAVKANGGKLLSGPMPIPGGDVVAICMDPQGAAFALHAPAPKQA